MRAPVGYDIPEDRIQSAYSLWEFLFPKKILPSHGGV